MIKKINKIRGKEINKISINMMSPDEIFDNSFGEVLNPETINYRSYKPERDGLFCERIFGPTKDYECACGKYKRIRYKGIICDSCGVEVTEKKVRRERSGHIQFIVPIVHVWYFNSNPNKIAYLLGIPAKKLKQIIYYEKYIIIQPAGAVDPEGKPYNYMDIISEDEYYEILNQFPIENNHLDIKDPNKFVAFMGGEAIEELLKRVNLEELSYQLRHKVEKETSKQRKDEALKRLQVIEGMRDNETDYENKPEWMVLRAIPVIPPELRPLVPLDGGRFATSDLNDLYRRVIIRNNRLKRLIEIKAPEVILRNEKRMLQEAVDSLFDNSRKSTSLKSDSNRPLKSLSDSLKGKTGRFRQNLLGKRVDYSGRSVIVVGPELELHECGLPKDMAAELFKPHIINKMIQRGIVKTVKSAKKIIDSKNDVIWDILENELKNHPVLLNRAPTLHRLGIQAFQPKLIEGKAIRLHPLVCTAFNADFDGDQMAVHLPLSDAAILEAQLLMLSSHNILNPANGAPVTVPSQDMVLGLYYMTKLRKSTEDIKILGEWKKFYSTEEVIIAYNEAQIDLNAQIKLKINVKDENGDNKFELIETSVGRAIFNEVVPEKVGYVNEVLTKKSLRSIISRVLDKCGIAATAKFLDEIKELGFTFAFKGGLSFSLNDIIIPKEKIDLVEKSIEKVNEVKLNYNMGMITPNERYNRIIDIWTHANLQLTNILMDRIEKDNNGFNSIYMMYDSGARGSVDQIKQLSGMRGLMAKPQKSGATTHQIIEDPILSNFKEGLSVLEYFISTHGARKGLADTALKTADAGYLTRRLVDVSQDIIINEEDCGTFRGVNIKALKKNDEIVESLSERIEGRVAANDILNYETGELLIAEGQMIHKDIAIKIEKAELDSVEVRSVLTCELQNGVCAKCYGKDLATNKMVRVGEAVGVIAAQSIGEPGTQLTLRTFHVGGVASNMLIESSVSAKYSGYIEIDDLRTTSYKNEEGQNETVVLSRSSELKIIDPKSNIILFNTNIPYGSKLYVENGQNITKGDMICEWDPFNAVILNEHSGKIKFENLEEGLSYRKEIDESTGFVDYVAIPSKDRKLIPAIKIMSKNNEVLKSYNIPIGAHISVLDGDDIVSGKPLLKIPRTSGKAGDITGGLPRVTELFEARKPSDPATISEIEGIVRFGKIKRGKQEIIIEAKNGLTKTYDVSHTKHILVQENDFVSAGTFLSNGSISPHLILAIEGPTAVQEYIVNEVQEVYRLQGVKINDKHFEVIVKQMMKKVRIIDSGDTSMLANKSVDKFLFLKENKKLFGKKVVIDAGNSENLKDGQIVTLRQLKEENAYLTRENKNLVEVRDVNFATADTVLQGITRASLNTNSFMSASSFQETTKVLNNAATYGKVDYLQGLKENVIIGGLIPAGPGLKQYRVQEVEIN